MRLSNLIAPLLGDRSVKENPKYSTILDSWFASHKLKIADSTAYNYGKAIPYLQAWFGDTLISDVTEQEVFKYVEYLRNSKRNYTSTRLYCKILKMSLRYAVRYGYINYNPADYVAMPGRRRAEIHTFTADEITLLLSVDGPQWVKDGIIICARTGMRPGEIYALKWSDINLPQHYISVQRAISKACSDTKTTKTPAGVRRVDIDSKLVQYLCDMQQAATSEYVFPGPPKGRYEYRVPWNLADKIRDMCIKAKIPPRNFYSLRHTHATLLLERGVHPKIVQERLGHSDSKITLDTYSHVSPTIQQRAVTVLETINL